MIFIIENYRIDRLSNETDFNDFGCKKASAIILIAIHFFDQVKKIKITFEHIKIVIKDLKHVQRKRGSKTEEQKRTFKFYNVQKILLICLMILLQWHLRLDIKQLKKFKEKGCLLDLAMGVKILTPKQMLQTLPIALAQVKAGDTSHNLLNEMWQIAYSLYQAKKSPKDYIL